MHKVIQFLQEKESEMVELLKEYVEMESPSVEKELTDEAGRWISLQFEKLLDTKTEAITNLEYGNHIRGVWGEGDGQILILAHMDTVWPRGTIQEMPFTVENGKAYGPGVFDMKGGTIQGLFALHALQQLGIKLRKKVVFLFTSDEEIGSPTSRELIEEEAKKSNFVLVLEPAMSKDGSLKTARKGVGMFHIKVHGVPAHAGVDPEKGISAIDEMARQTIYLHSLTDLNVGSTVNVGILQAGTNSNVIAAEAAAEVDLRVKTQKEFDRLVPKISKLKPYHSEVSIEVTGGINRPPMERTEQVQSLFKIAKSIAKNHLHFTLTEKETGGASDGSFTAPITPTLDGLGAVGDGAHAMHEHLVIKEMPIRSALLALILMELGH